MRKKQIIAISFAVGLAACSVFGSYAAVAQSRDHAAAVLTAQLSARVGFVPPPEDGAPEHPRGGATRDSSDAFQVLPEGAKGLTVSSRPMVQVYFKEGVEQVWMKVESIDGSESYRYDLDTTFALPEGEGVAEVPFPESMNELTLDKQYVWQMALLCSDPLGPTSPVISGSIRRVTPPSDLDEISNLSLLEKANAYGKAGLWYDFISALTQMKLGNDFKSRRVRQYL